ncbi:hypothetical protein GO495_16770 [Chitinophaga oryziterrae]|uniref:Erythromycin biosynthesis protein CIII-like C-terminal domain-containing protein n=1 Tax=Chitinophaga oryziterrae TaxID=1031224 RepID=A0A6N8JD12_9BACT|nr:nucleotide disphospho-sugar-binding domain-containing protein [Chitinophaga oryziterrae]MVT42246.1 hypothetical protein [Chitinophaga oryziterrae]
MAKIIIIMDAEEGHILPSFSLAHAMKHKGHEVVYLSICDNEMLVKEEGFGFVPAFEKKYPKGYREQYKLRHERPIEENNESLSTLVSQYQHILDTLKADLYIVSTFLRIDLLLLYYRFNIRPIVFTTYLRDPGVTLSLDCIGDLLRTSPDLISEFLEWLDEQGLDIRSMEQLASPLDQLKELVACPQEIDFDTTAIKDNRIYIGPCIRTSLSNDPQVTGILGKTAGKPLIFASLGSQVLSYGKQGTDLLKQLIAIMTMPGMDNLEMVLSIGPETDKGVLGQIPSNVTVVSWISQIDILAVASAAIIHGGLGTVKECLFYGVPMLVIPFTRDQPSNAKRIVYHGLGLAADLRDLEISQLKEDLLQLLQNNEIRDRVVDMQQVFIHQQSTQKVIDSIEEKFFTNKKVMLI